MLQCSECEYFVRGPGDQITFKCDPFVNVREPECLVKWQLLRTSELTQRVERMVAAYEATLAVYKRLEPLQEKMFRHMEREIDDAEDSDAWKYGANGDEDEEAES